MGTKDTDETENMWAALRQKHDSGAALTPLETMALRHANAQALRVLVSIGQPQGRE